MASIPVIDISDSNPDAPQQLLQAAAESGFLFVANAEDLLGAGDVKGMFDLGKEFFACPNEVKQTCTINIGENAENRGWTKMHGEILDPDNQKKGDFKEAFNFSSTISPAQALSGPLAPSRDSLIAFETKCHLLCQRILRLFAAALSLEDPTWFTARHDQSRGDTGSILRLLWYPSLQRLRAEALAQSAGVVSDGVDAAKAAADKWEHFDEETDVRAGAHSDYGSVTLLFQQRGQPGLEILTREGKWASVPVDPLGNTPPTALLPILVNIGDLLAYWTNGLFRSTIHRVIFPMPPADPSASFITAPPAATAATTTSRAVPPKQHDRYSIAYFCHPLDTAKLEAVPSAIVAARSGTEDARREMEKVRALSGKGAGMEGVGSAGVLTARQHLAARLGATYA